MSDRKYVLVILDAKQAHLAPLGEAAGQLGQRDDDRLARLAGHDDEAQLRDEGVHVEPVAALQVRGTRRPGTEGLLEDGGEDGVGDAGDGGDEFDGAVVGAEDCAAGWESLFGGLQALRCVVWLLELGVGLGKLEGFAVDPEFCVLDEGCEGSVFADS
ncbi:hypothetical protein HYFRA_00005861 [Hymenoscyphus fraxineus]|uniref:Uncharacterized protein n=1 Tax=Hymenoscyphus fraxineus TaxID=746836 RepID=A0A9N9KW87_9HELO|nr:hypothetical protein HYFRA_00005861 [Hymenoscyphus fraxineus]